MIKDHDGPAIAISGLRVVRGKRPVIPDLTLEVPAGQVVGLLGPSGSGKSTLMRAVVGVQIVAGGTVRVLGHEAGSPALRRDVGYVTQTPSVYGDLTIRGNISYFGRAVGLRGAELHDAVDRTLVEVDLVSHADVLVRDLSGGQESRVSLAGALVGRPTLLVLDEPTVGLDPVLRRDLWDLFRRLAQQGHSLMVSSHVMDEAARCDRLVLLRDGRVLADLTPAELLSSTGQPDADAAFLALVDAAGGEEIW
ncbi:multidrug ABC transporter ATPase [Intrasporangium oryzae NRRL B-24470]|uniref:Multidrug ABC transporter ATPase n=1 Tax=Intrasporangium oryzae NRRL B-24470 TaxID=1386089 RepID=W9GBK3_9MICO|nr:ABC transporter ATP-binding protein [Intrasporangium oryzae]EWT03566.1 multidrug ABC transporter ATPase [Intrasporangium oryzae NRRL B-24470]